MNRTEAEFYFAAKITGSADFAVRPAAVNAGKKTVSIWRRRLIVAIKPRL
jgi:hypothetical protein